jgi:hypothetical protein
MYCDEQGNIEAKIKAERGCPKKGPGETQIPVIIELLAFIRSYEDKDHPQGGQLKPEKDAKNAHAIFPEQAHTGKGYQEVEKEKAFIKSQQESYSFTEFQ